MDRVVVVGTGLIGSSLALALRAAGFNGHLTGVDRSEDERLIAMRMGCFEQTFAIDPGQWRRSIRAADVVVLATPVLAVLHWMELLLTETRAGQLITDVGSTKSHVAQRARDQYNLQGRASFLPGHPMAGKESGGAAGADSCLFQDALWLFTPVTEQTELMGCWRGWVERIGARVLDLDPLQHDEVCAWTSHLPQLIATALASLLQERFGANPMVQAVGGRAIREMTRLGASPYSMWRDIAVTNDLEIGNALQAMEQQLLHLRDNLKTQELRELFSQANNFHLPRA